MLETGSVPETDLVPETGSVPEAGWQQPLFAVAIESLEIGSLQNRFRCSVRSVGFGSSEIVSVQSYCLVELLAAFELLAAESLH